MERAVVGDILRSLRHTRSLLQVVVGPRQVGKTTAAQHVAARWNGPVVLATADEPLPPGPEWIETQWARARAQPAAGGEPPLLVLDEVQKVRGWQETVKRLWDEDGRLPQRPVACVLLGSSALLLQHGASESLAGRFFLHRALPWTFPECRAAFGWDLEAWLVFGGYPGAAPFANDPVLWRRYILDSLIEAVVTRDVLQLQTVGKPALLRQLFLLACAHPAQVLSYTKMLGQLHDAGNTTTLAGYLHLLHQTFLITGLQPWSGSVVRTRAASPKLVVRNNALVSATSGTTPDRLARDAAWRGRLVENAVGAHLLNHLVTSPWDVGTWRDGDREVDFVLSRPGAVLGIEVKSGRPRAAGGVDAFRLRAPGARVLVIGSGGIPLEEFLETDPRLLLESVG